MSPAQTRESRRRLRHEQRTGGRPRRRRVPAFLRHYLEITRVLLVRWRHDLHAILVEDIQNVAVQLRVEKAHALRGVAVRVDLVDHVERAERELQHEWRLVWQESRRARG